MSRSFMAYLLSVCVLFFSWDIIQSPYSTLQWAMVWLTLYLITICILISMNSVNYNVLLYLGCLVFMGFILVVAFLTEHVLIFYICFESTLVPMFFMVLGWGARNQKMRAAFYLFFFTLISSLMMLLGLVKLYFLTGTLHLSELRSLEVPFYYQKWLFLSFILAFGVKIPLFPFHIWLPQAHVEAPLAGSVLLAGILLKLGGYGIIAIAYSLYPLCFLYYGPVLQWVSLIGVIYGGLTTIRQSDAKRLIAYSSVAHMGFCVYALFSSNLELGFSAGFLIMVAHGFISPALFITAGVIYERYGTRVLKYYKGLSVIMPLGNSLAFLATLCSIAFPGSLNFVGEFYVVLIAAQENFLQAILISLGGIIGLVYSLYFYMRLFTGSFSPYLLKGRELNGLEVISLSLLIIPCIISGIYPYLLISAPLGV